MAVAIAIKPGLEAVTSVSCKVCLADYSSEQMYDLDVCKCSFCILCMKQYAEVMIAEGNVLTIHCPDPMCRIQGKLQSSEIAKLVDCETFDRYTRFRFEREIDVDPKRSWCPQAGCETVCHVAEGTAASGQQTPVTCPKCGLQFCPRCKCPWHGIDVTCDEALRNHGGASEGIPFSADVDADIKRCPVCRVPIERDAGCAQMMCKNCKHVFCWYCLQSLDDDFLLRHFDKGPCKDRLGHTRASLIWHRIQVVGIFASFALLLLLAFPFLLLAAPCLLCCKCKACRRICSVCMTEAEAAAAGEEASAERPPEADVITVWVDDEPRASVQVSEV